MDTDIILNFATDTSVAHAPRANKKGGRWTDRQVSTAAYIFTSRILDRVKATRVAKRKERPAPSDKSTEVPVQPKKKPRLDSFVGSRVNNVSASSKASQPAKAIISSLFTSNPRIEPVAETKTPAKTSSNPSNAPTSDETAFSGLGLDSLIISHLMAKMNITNPTPIQKGTLPVILSEETKERDVFIQSQTGSGKTLAFLLPIIQDLLPLSELSWIDRSIGTLAIIIAPTRELAKQINDVLESLLQMRLRPTTDDGVETTSARLTRWLVSGLLTGGATRNHEKTRLRKGCPIVVSTPGRLLDHLQNTSSFNVSKCRWLVLDEADRLMELGFEETVQGIIQGLDGRRRLALAALQDGTGLGGEVGGWDWERRRRTILCSATIREDVQKLAGQALTRPLMIKGGLGPVNTAVETVASEEKFTPPSQLAQKYVLVPLKLRLVTLIALLRSLISESGKAGKAGRGTKIIVFMSCTDSVDFHWKLLSDVAMDAEDIIEGEAKSSTSVAPADKTEAVEATSELLPNTSLYRLHGSLAQATRNASLKAFSTSSNRPAGSSSVLFCTSVASRGLDLPLVRAVIQYDLPTEGGANEYVHRVGRTARVGKGGEAWAIVAPSEADWIPWVEAHMSDSEKTTKVKIHGIGNDQVLKDGFGGHGKEYESRATDVQLSLERWALAGKENADLARKAFQSHVRAYSTHPSNEKHIFHIRNLHLGHLAKAFALRDAPTQVKPAQMPVKSMGHVSAKTKSDQRKTEKLKHTGQEGKIAVSGSKHPKIQASRQGQREWEEGHDGDAERRMQAIVRAQGKLTKQGGMMRSMGASEFQIASGPGLEKLVHGSQKR